MFFSTKFNPKHRNRQIKNYQWQHIYIYIIDDSIKIYDGQTFKELAIIKLPFIRKKPMLDIADNETLIYFADSKLYFYKINIKEKKFSFMHYLSEIFHFCYLQKRKEILLLTDLVDKPSGMARCDLLGNIIFANKVKPKIYYDFEAPKPIEKVNFPTHVQSTSENFSKFYGFNGDKYIINIYGIIDNWYDYKIGFGNTEINFNITIYNTDNLNEIFNQKIFYDLRYYKISDNLFKYENQDGLFYYNEKENKIMEISNLYNYISKCFISYYKEQIEKYDKNQHGYYNPKIKYDEFMKYDDKIKQHINQFKYFYLNDNMFAVYDGNYNIYIIDISVNNNHLRWISLKSKLNDYTEINIKDISYSQLDKNEFLFISFQAKNKKSKIVENKIIHGNII